MTTLHIEMDQGDVSAIVGTYLWFATAPGRPNCQVMTDAVRAPEP